MIDEEKKEEIVEEDADEVVDQDPKKVQYSIPWRGFIIVFSILITLIIVCVVVIFLNGGFDQWSK